MKTHLLSWERIKYLGINLPKERQICNSKTVALDERNQREHKHGKIFCVFGLEESKVPNDYNTPRHQIQYNSSIPQN